MPWIFARLSGTYIPTGERVGLIAYDFSRHDYSQYWIRLSGIWKLINRVDIVQDDPSPQIIYYAQAERFIEIGEQRLFKIIRDALTRYYRLHLDQIEIDKFKEEHP